MSSPVSRKMVKHRAMLGVAPASKTQDPSHATTPITTTPARTILDTSLEENVDVRDDDDNHDDASAPSPPSYLSSIFSSTAFQLKSSSPHNQHAIMHDQRTRRSPTMAFVPDKADPMMLDCLSLDGCLLPPSTSETFTMTTTSMVMTRKKKEL